MQSVKKAISIITIILCFVLAVLYSKTSRALMIAWTICGIMSLVAYVIDNKKLIARVIDKKKFPEDAKRMDTIADSITKGLKEKREIMEDQVYMLQNASCEYFENPDNFRMPESYSHLKERLDAKFAYGEYKDMTPEQVWLYGAVWGCMGMVQSWLDTKKENIECIHLMLLYMSGPESGLLTAVGDHPGIRESELQQQSGLSKSKVKTLMDNLRKENLVMIQKEGRISCYFLSTKGEKVKNLISDYHERGKTRDMLNAVRHNDDPQMKDVQGTDLEDNPPVSSDKDAAGDIPEDIQEDEGLSGDIDPADEIHPTQADTDSIGEKDLSVSTKAEKENPAADTDWDALIAKIDTDMQTGTNTKTTATNKKTQTQEDSNE